MLKNIIKTGKNKFITSEKYIRLILVNKIIRHYFIVY